MYPASPEESRQRVMRFIDLVAAQPDITDEDAIAVLMQDGVGDVDAELLIRFVPCGLSFALLKLMGLDKFPNTYQVKNSAGQWVEFPLAAEHYFAVALSIGYEVTTRGYTERITKKTFQAVTLRSAEMDAVNRFFASGGKRLAGGILSPPTFFGGLTAEQIAASRAGA